MMSSYEHILVSCHKAGMIDYMNSHPEAFTEAIELAISDKQPFAWRSAWLLWSCMEKNDPRFRRYISKILAVIANKEDGHQRELIKILHQMDLDADSEGRLFDLCVSVWLKKKKKPSVRFTAFKFIVSVVKTHPELRSEFVQITSEDYLDTLSPGVRRSIDQMISEVEHCHVSLDER